MVNLKSCEILDELKKLGIEIPSDIMDYIKEYSAYVTDPEKNGGRAPGEDNNAGGGHF